MVNKKELEKFFNTKEALNEIKDRPEADGILKQNIERANRFLDKIEEKIMNSKKPSSFLLDASAKIMDVINKSVSQMGVYGFEDEGIEIKKKQLELKELELLLKTIGKDEKVIEKHKELIVTDRQSLIEMIKEKGLEQIGETINVTNNQDIQNN